MSHALGRLPTLVPRRETLAWGTLVLFVEATALVAFLAFGPVAVVDPLYVVLPFVWINVAIWAVVRTVPPDAGGRTRRAGLLVGAAYFLLLAGVGGVLGPGHLFHGHTHGTGLALSLSVPPGWGPMVLYTGPLVSLVAVPYKLAGYAALAYLVYATVLEASGTVGALVGLFSCVSCTWPVLGTVLAGVLGGGSAVAAFAVGQPYLTSTAVYLSAVGLLVWLPTR